MTVGRHLSHRAAQRILDILAAAVKDEAALRQQARQALPEWKVRWRSPVLNTRTVLELDTDGRVIRTTTHIEKHDTGWRIAGRRKVPL